MLPRTARCVFLVFSILSLTGCDDKPSLPTSVNTNDFPAAPTNVKAFVGDATIVLTWSHPHADAMSRYNIYRQDSTESEFKIAGSTEELRYTDSSLQSNREFRYQISALGKNGLEGSPSKIIKAVPAVYGVSVNFGQEFTTSQTVTLLFTAPRTTSLVKIGNDDSLLTNAQWESFVTTRNWTLSFDDGKKTVFVKFRDAEDRETIHFYSDSIVLDTQAIIKQVTENSGGRVLTSEDIIHFTVITDEPGGRAWVDLSHVQSGVKLYDDGTNGDSLPDDGIYEREFDISTGSEAENASVTGHFVDRAGNVATTINASGAVTIRRPPEAVDLISVSPVISSSNALNLFWSENSDSDFAHYRIFRSNESGVDTGSSLATIIQDRGSLSFTDSTLVSNTTYFYRVYVFDTSGLFSGSNEMSGTTNSK
ncbi:MAG: fibronectin type III domain-containing protein [bacterium]